MAYQIKLKKSVLKDINKLPENTIDKILIIIEEKLSNNPRQGKALKGKYLGLWRIRFGVYRIIYEIKSTELVVLVVRISHRKDAYQGII
ncbi:hypothetical protein B6I21_04385 [candidate division KSB1 bacterium 4572_119]|nr:MAG: hypothetical protein B6I21_04385 [candidate division KSB1 bacterium 4572_119]